jgi:hypothetical protein
MPNNATGRKLTRTLKRVQRRRALNTEPVILRWRTASGASPHANVNLPVSLASTTYTDHSETLYPFVHFVSIQTKSYVKFTQITEGDVILDFIGDVAIDGRLDLEFEIAGIRYIQKKTGDELSKSWDVRCNGVAITRSVLISPKS